jgi:hypothetical protein
VEDAATDLPMRENFSLPARSLFHDRRSPRPIAGPTPYAYGGFQVGLMHAHTTLSITRMRPMKGFARLLLATALACATATAASAYHLSPPDISARLRGTLTFYPDGGKPFHCKVIFYLKTKGIIKSAEVESPGGCKGLDFAGLPWFVGIINADTGDFGSLSFTGGGGGCGEGAELFQDNASGVWTLPDNGQCMSGTLVSRPPVTITP